MLHDMNISNDSNCNKPGTKKLKGVLHRLHQKISMFCALS